MMKTLAAVILMASAASAQSASLYFDPPSKLGALATGDTFSISVKTDLVGWSIYLVDFAVTWDPAVLELESRQISDEWQSPFDCSGWGSWPSGWQYCCIVEFSQDGTNFTTGTHTIVTYTFRVVGPGSTALTIETALEAGPWLAELAGNGVIADPVGNAQYPTPIPVQILTVSGPTSATIGDVVELSADVNNFGTVARDVTVEFWASPTQKLGAVTQNIAAGQTVTVKYAWHTDFFDAATYPMYAVLNGTITYFTPMHLKAIPVVTTVVETGAGGGGGGGGCSSGSGAGNMVPMMALLVILVARRIVK